MPRLRQVPRAEVTDPHTLEMYDRLFGPDRDPVADPGTATGSPGDWWTVYALSPDVLKHAVLGFELYQNPNRALDPTLRELGQIRTGWLVGSQFVFSQHMKVLRAMGKTEEWLADLPSWTVSDQYSPAERAILAYTDALVGERGRVPDGVFAELKNHISDEAILEATYITTMYVQQAILTRALRLEWDDVPERVVEVAGPENAEELGSDIIPAFHRGD
jgi:alkylhydroperoxidase family enzyme